MNSASVPIHTAVAAVIALTVGLALGQPGAARGEGVRDPSKAQSLREAGVEVVAGDLDRPGTLDAAFRGVDRVFLLTPPNPNQVTQARNGIAAARRVGVPHLVRLSTGAFSTKVNTARVTRQHVVAVGAVLRKPG